MTSVQLERRLAKKTGRTLKLVLTNNRHRVLTYRPDRSAPDELRVSRIFLAADDEILEALAAFIKGSRRARHVLQRFADLATERQARRRARRGLDVQTAGEVYDLQAIFDKLNVRYFGGGVDAYITWGRRRSLPGKRTVQLGTYSESERLIRINPVLDQRQVPRHVVEKVVYHEMLHHVLTPKKTTGRRCLHGKEFNEHESKFPRFDEAEQWLNRNLRVVLG